MSDPKLDNALEHVRYTTMKRREGANRADADHRGWVAAIKVASALGVSNIDIARAAGVTRQRIQQILEEGTK